MDRNPAGDVYGELEQLYRCVLCSFLIIAPKLACKVKEFQAITLSLFPCEEEDLLQTVDERRMLKRIGEEDGGPIFSRRHWRSSQSRKTFRKALARLDMPNELVGPSGFGCNVADSAEGRRQVAYLSDSCQVEFG